MTKSYSLTDLMVSTNDQLDDKIAKVANMTLGDVVFIAEGNHPTIRFTRKDSPNAGEFLVCRLFTDAIFSQDIRAIQLIINRMDGGVPSETDVDKFQTAFGDCLSELMQLTEPERMRVSPQDSVLMGLCKSLYDMAVQDIYWDSSTGKRKRPSTDTKRDRDAAMRLILERVGGRKTHALVEQDVEDVEIADWIKSLPSSDPE